MSKLLKDWSTKELGEVAVVQTGLAKGKNNIKDPVTLPYLRVANVQDGYLDLSEVKTIEVSRAEIDRYRLRPGDVLMTEGGDFDKLGRGHVWKGQIDLCLHQNHIFVVRPNPQLLKPEFLLTLSTSPYGRRYFLLCAKQTTNLASINATQLKQFPVLLPPMEQQEKITKMLSFWDRGIEKLEEFIAAKSEFKLGLMQQLLTGRKRFNEFRGQEWKLEKLGGVCQLVNGLAFKPSDWKASGLPIIRIQNLNGSKIFNYYQGNVEGTYIINDEDLLFSWSGSRGTSFGPFIWKGPRGVLNQHIFRVLSFDMVDKYYLHHALKFITQEIEAKAHGSAGLVHITKRELEKHELFLPVNLNEQRRIAGILDACDRELDLLREQLAEFKNQKKGLIQKLLTGKIRLRVNEPEMMSS